MNNYINGKISVFADNNNVDATVVLTNIESSEQIKSVSWEETIEAIAVKSEDKGLTHFAKAWNDKPAKRLQWFREDENIRFEIWYQKKGEEWTFKNEYTLSVDDLEAFEIVHSYNFKVMSSLKKDFVNDALDGTTFLTRES